MEMINDEALDMASECLKTIAHPKRLRILNFLEEGKQGVTEIVSVIETSQSVASDHLRLMEARGILKSEKEGRRVFYSLAIPEMVTILNCIRNNKLKRNFS